MFLLRNELLYCIWTRICAKRMPSLPMAEHSRKDSGADKMKINRTFSIDYLIAKELKTKTNQSAFVNRAIHDRLAGSSGNRGASDLPFGQLLAILHAHDDCDPFLQRVLNQILARRAAEKHAVSDKESLSS